MRNAPLSSLLLLATLAGFAGCGEAGRSTTRTPEDSTPASPNPTQTYPSSTFMRLPGRDGAVDSFGVSPHPSRAGTLDSFLLDELGQLYRWSPDHTLTKFVAASEVLSGVAPELRYRNQRLGTLQQVDLTNPLRPVLFYGAAQTVVWLDRNLAELRQLALVDLDLGRIDAVAYGPNDALWVYAPDRQQLILIDRQGVRLQQSPVLSQVFGTPVRADELVATAQQVSLATRDGRVLLFGPFGAYRTQVLRPGRYLVADESRLLFHDAGRWWAVGGEQAVPNIVEAGTGGQALLMVRGARTLWHRAGRVWVE